MKQTSPFKISFNVTENKNVQKKSLSKILKRRDIHTCTVISTNKAKAQDYQLIELLSMY